MNNQFLMELQDYIYKNLEEELKSVGEYESGSYALMETDSFEVESIEAIELPQPKKTERPQPTVAQCFQRMAMPSEPQTDIEEYIRKTKNKETFSTRLLKYIYQTGLPDAEIYKSAGIDRRHFSKIRCDKDYQPKKQTVVALCLALHLKLAEAEEMLELAGYSLSNCDTADLVVKFCIEKGKYDLMEVNEALEYFGMKTIGVVG